PSLPYTPQHDSPIKKLAIIRGSPIPFHYKPTQLPPHLFLTPHIKHHHPLHPKIQNLNLLHINHYTQYLIKEPLKQLLQKSLFKYQNQFP
ncbi:Nif3-like dinuclear metal center hexameric protein, partial [Staphylococcus epidermidis]|uniref:Nif3-like dinuclear metal center hexameric protein n=1 Tax=Staphylococcus epidermidis TaxID=1282 RepID=UPI0016435B43